MNYSGFKPQELHPCTVSTSDGVQWPVSCFAHDLMWQACQLLNACVDSKHRSSLERLDTQRPRRENVRRQCSFEGGAIYNVHIPPLHGESLNPRGDHSP